jgi:hypothetical protein
MNDMLNDSDDSTVGIAVRMGGIWGHNVRRVALIGDVGNEIWPSVANLKRKR